LLCDNTLFVLMVLFESGLACMRAGGFCGTRLGELGGHSKRKALA